MDEIAQAARFGGLILLQLSCRSRLVFALLGREDIRLTQGKAVLGSEPEKPLEIHGLREGLGQIRVAVAKREKPPDPRETSLHHLLRTPIQVSIGPSGEVA